MEPEEYCGHNAYFLPDPSLAVNPSAGSRVGGGKGRRPFRRAGWKSLGCRGVSTFTRAHCPWCLCTAHLCLLTLWLSAHQLEASPCAQCPLGWEVALREQVQAPGWISSPLLGPEVTHIDGVVLRDLLHGRQHFWISCCILSTYGAPALGLAVTELLVCPWNLCTSCCNLAFNELLMYTCMLQNSCWIPSIYGAPAVCLALLVSAEVVTSVLHQYSLSWEGGFAGTVLKAVQKHQWRAPQVQGGGRGGLRARLEEVEGSFLLEAWGPHCL